MYTYDEYRVSGDNTPLALATAYNKMRRKTNRVISLIHEGEYPEQGVIDDIDDQTLACKVERDAFIREHSNHYGMVSLEHRQREYLEAHAELADLLKARTNCHGHH